MALLTFVAGRNLAVRFSCQQKTCLKKRNKQSKRGGNIPTKPFNRGGHPGAAREGMANTILRG